MKRKTGIFITVFAAVILICAILGGCGASSEESVSSNTISSVLLTDGGANIEITARLTPTYVSAHRNSSVYLFEFSADETDDVSLYLAGELKKTPLLSHSAEEKMTFKIPAANGVNSRIYSSFVIAEYDSDTGKFVALTDRTYVSNADLLASVSEPYPDALSLKGLVTDSAAQASELGAAHTVITVSYADFIRTAPTADAYTQVCDGITYFFDKTAVDALDSKIKSFTEAGVNVYLNFVLENKTDSPSFLCLEASETSPYLTVNMSDAESVRYIRAFFEFFAGRYTRTDAEYGFAASYIIGKDANAMSSVNGISTEVTSQKKYIDNYTSLLRMAYTALISNYADGRIYISVNNNFSRADELVGSDMHAKAFIGEVCGRTSDSGDFPWGSSLGITLDSTDVGDYGYGYFITPSNFSDMTLTLSTEAYLCNGKQRSIIVSDLKIPADTQPFGEGNCDAQSAAYIYAMYKAVENGHIDAVIYGCDIDPDSDDNGYGLICAETSDGGDISYTKRSIYYAFATVDTDSTDYIGNFMSEHTELYNKQKDKIQKIKLCGGAAYDKIPGSQNGYDGADSANYLCETLFSFANGDILGFDTIGGNGFTFLAADNSGNSPSTVPVLKASFENNEYAAVGVFNNNVYFPENRNIKYIGITFYAELDSPSCSVRLRLTDRAGGVDYFSKSVMIANGQPYTLYFDISQFTQDRDLSSVPISLAFEVSAADGDAFGQNVSLCVKNIDICSIDTAFPLAAKIAIIAVSSLAAVALITVAVVLVIRSTKKRKPSEQNETGFDGFGPAFRDRSGR